MDLRGYDLERDRLFKGAIAGLIIVLVLGLAAVDQMMVERQANSFEAQGTAVMPEENQTDLGLVADKSLNFGEVPAGAAVRKEVKVEASEGSLVDVSVNGNISRHMDHTETRLDGNHRIEVVFNASEPGYYTGDVIIKTQSPKNGLAATWLGIKQ